MVCCAKSGRRSPAIVFEFETIPFFSPWTLVVIIGMQMDSCGILPIRRTIVAGMVGDMRQDG